MMTQVLYHKNKWLTPAMKLFIDVLKFTDPENENYHNIHELNI